MRLNTPQFWRKRTWLALILYPVSVVFSVIVGIRRWCFRTGVLRSWQSPVPVVVVGNLTAGGAGKTPLVIALVEHLRRSRKSVGVVTRGYGGKVSSRQAVVVNSDSNAADVGDEALMLSRRTGVAVVAGRDRSAAIRHLLSQYPCDVVICDDGLQHYALQRDIEIVVVDSDYQVGNGFCLPAGPLREPVSRADEADLTVYAGRERTLPGYELNTNAFINGKTKEQLSVNAFVSRYKSSMIHAVAAIAHPQKYFNTLNATGLRLIEHRFPDHYAYQVSDLEFPADLPIVMTEKDHVKCENWIGDNSWYLSVSAAVDGIILEEFDQLLTRAEQRVQL